MTVLELIAELQDCDPTHRVKVEVWNAETCSWEDVDIDCLVFGADKTVSIATKTELRKVKHD